MKIGCKINIFKIWMFLKMKYNVKFFFFWKNWFSGNFYSEPCNILPGIVTSVKWLLIKIKIMTG